MKKALIIFTLILSAFCSGFTYDQTNTIPPIDYSYPTMYYPIDYHFLKSISGSGDSLEIDDGSIWTFHPSYYSELLSWKTTDPLRISINSGWFSPHNYVIENLILGTKIPITMIESPIMNASTSIQVIDINYEYGILYLTNNTSWQVQKSNLYILRDWGIGDYITIGSYSSFFSSEKNILINSYNYTHVKAKQL